MKAAAYNNSILLTNPIARAYPSAQVLQTPKQSGTPRPKECGFFTPIVFSMVGRAENKTPERGIISPDFARFEAPDHPHFADGQLPSKEQRIMTALTILTTKIRQLDGLYSLNDLHKAAGGEEKHAPTNFMRLDQTQALIEEIKSAEMQICTKTVRGGQGGTYVCRELVYAYAMWISAKFHLQVIRAFDALHNPADRTAQMEEIGKVFEKQYQKLRKQYNYPRKLLEQSGFVSADGKHPARLNISMLANTKAFISPLMHLLNEMRIDGHDISAPWDEFIAMREALIAADKALERIYTEALQVNFKSASTAGNK